ncbi:MAG: hypothetical protein LUH11_02550, partial [Candidatus Gastranaerophilales bacterium]|nr:hypothetical protein [Candidatus Gastranaerophilales bacterium]
KADSDIKGEVKIETTKPAPAALDKTTLKDITFKNGKATTSTGENFTGTIEDTLNNGKKVELTYKDGVISKSAITEGKTTVYKDYENGRIESNVTLDGCRCADGKFFSYDENEKIIEIFNSTTKETKNLLYDTNGSYKGYELKSPKNGTIQTYSKDGSLIETKSDFSEEITEAVQKLKNNNSDIKEIKLKNGTTTTVVRKTKVLNRNTGKYEDMYITSLDNKNFYIRTADGTQYGSMQLWEPSPNGWASSDYQLIAEHSSDAYGTINFVDIHSLRTNNNGMDATQYRGLGTELVKQAVIESYDRGHLGRIGLNAANFTGEGRCAETFYSHIGMSKQGGSSHYSFPEYNIAQFLSR